MIKSILGGKSKNLFDISKANVVINANIFNPVELKCFYKIPVTPRKTYTVSCDTTTNVGAGEQLQLSAQTGDGWREGTQLFIFITSQEMVKDWVHIKATFTIPDNITQITFSALRSKFFRNFQIELGSTATEYVPHELTSYKSIMKVSDVCQLVPMRELSKVDRGVTFTSNGDGSITVNGTPTGTYYSVGTIALDIKAIKLNHKYIIYDDYYDGNTIIGDLIIASYSGGYMYKTFGKIFTFPEHNYTRFVFEVRVFLNQTANNIVVHPQLFDLTEMFGAGNEPKTVAEFKAKFPNDYYLYSPSCFVTSFDERMPCKTKNLFSSSTEVGVPSSTKFDKSEKRLLEDGKWYVGLTGSNYYSRNSVLDYSIMENSVYIKWRSNGYSAAKCIYCEPNTTYSFTKKYSLIQGYSLGINVGFYTEDGTFISIKGETASPRFVFTTPENCKYVSICLSGTKFQGDNFGAGCFSDLQLVKGTTATDYVPYGYV